MNAPTIEVVFLKEGKSFLELLKDIIRIKINSNIALPQKEIGQNG